MSKLARLLDTPLLARVVPHLQPETLQLIVQHEGLDACGELITSATPAQLTSLLDIDLWHGTQPGRDDQFDVDRFGEWLEVLIETGEAARIVAALDRDLVVVGLARYIRVLDPGIFEPIEQSDDERIDRHDALREADALDDESGGDGLDAEIGGYIVRARRTDAWDAILALLVSLEAEHVDAFHSVMRGCRDQSFSRPEVDGLSDLLQSPEQHLHDVAVEREQRRSQQGYATPADARAFLQMARLPRDQRAENPIVAAYFRAVNETPEPPSAPVHSADLRSEPTDEAQLVGAAMQILADAGIMPAGPRALLQGAEEDPRNARLTRLRHLMKCAAETDVNVYLTRTSELAFLANVLGAGCTVQSRAFTPQEASDAAASVCNLGLECLAVEGSQPDSFLVDHDLVAAFETGWRELHQQVGLFAANELIKVIDGLRSVDRGLKRELKGLRQSLAVNADAGTPWLARRSADVLAALDAAAWTSVIGLLGECPVLAEALSAVLDGRTSSVSQTAFAFVSTRAHIDDVRAFMRKLPDLL